MVDEVFKVGSRFYGRFQGLLNEINEFWRQTLPLLCSEVEISRKRLVQIPQQEFHFHRIVPHSERQPIARHFKGHHCQAPLVGKLDIAHLDERVVILEA